MKHIRPGLFFPPCAKYKIGERAQSLFYFLSTLLSTRQLLGKQCCKTVHVTKNILYASFLGLFETIYFMSNLGIKYFIALEQYLD